MNFEKLWPTAKPGQSPVEALALSREDYHALPKSTWKYRIAHYLKSKEARPCCVCETYTPWIEINFEGHICSEECDNIKWAEYEEACRLSDHKELDIKKW